MNKIPDGAMAEYKEMAEHTPDQKAKEAFRRPAYSVAGYMARKYDIKGEIDIGQKKAEAVQEPGEGSAEATE